ncbi:MAG: restriction endonuclease [Polyangiaceae bacterium]
MSKLDRIEIGRRLDLLEAATRPQAAELLALDVLQPLLEADGYTVAHTGGPGDKGIDFLATRSDVGGSLPPRVGIQYKHLGRPVGADTVQQVIGASYTNNLQRMLLVAKSGFSASARAMLERALPTSLELLDLDFLRSWAARFDAAPPNAVQTSAMAAIAEVSALLARIIARSPAELDNIEWRDLERMLATIFAKLGFQTTLTPSAKDGGKDVILRFSVATENREFVVEAKHWRSGQKVGSGYVNDFLRVVATEQRHGGLLLATAGYTGTAFETLTEIERKLFYPGDQTKVIALCRTFVRAEAGLFTAPADMTSVITDDTLDA